MLATLNRSSRCRFVAQYFDLPEPGARPALPVIEPPEPGRIMLITGPSGSGKSSLLGRMMKSHRRRWIDLSRFRLPNRALADCFEDLPIERALETLAGVGLGEARTYLLTPRQLSDGQRWRVRLAMSLHWARQPSRRWTGSVIVADEFAALLDRVTAAVVARAVRRQIDRAPRTSAVLATSHEDIIGALKPDQVVRCDFDAIQQVWSTH